MKIAPFSVTEHIGQAGDLLREHYDELATDKRLMVLAPRLEVYRAMEESNSCIAVGAFGVDGKLFGYAVSFLAQHPHYSGLRVCQNDVLFVAKARRNGPAGIRLIRESERLAAAAGAGMFIWHAKPNTALEQLLPRLCYGVQDVLYSKALTPWHSVSAQQHGEPSAPPP